MEISFQLTSNKPLPTNEMRTSVWYYYPIFVGIVMPGHIISIVTLEPTKTCRISESSVTKALLAPGFSSNQVV